jgi:hypothetical protein
MIYSRISQSPTTFTVKYIPSWFPGAGFKKTAAEYAAVAREALEKPHKFTVSQLVSSLLFVLKNADPKF